MTQGLFYLFLCLVFLPISIDNYLNFSLWDYDIRPQYISLFLFYLFFLIFGQKKIIYLNDFYKNNKKLIYLWGSFFIVGLIGLQFSVVPKRTILFLIWSVGTMLGVPLFVWIVNQEIPSFLKKIFIVYLGLQSLLIIVDGILCIPTEGALHIARVMIYSVPGKETLCRPHGFYQEPGYFAAFALIGLNFLIGIKFSHSFFWEKIKKGTLFLSILAILICTSRMGWLGLCWIGLSSILFVNRLQLKDRKILKKLGFGFLSVLFIFSSLLYFKWDAFHQQVIPDLTSPLSDGSYLYRFNRMRAAYRVFKDHPWFGVGAGGAGAYLVDHYNGESWIMEIAADIPFLRRDPLSQNLYTELLSEWGVLGFIFFFWFLWEMTSSLSFSRRFTFLGTLLIIYLSTQTLPRFDLWMLIGMMTMRVRNDSVSAS
ncbi:MAG: hypothetical protein CL678_19035 [Bdellovibrionaceae bacterium]|nr:hypothetical protein [Pseudobdellovibrionaceae bacterium]|tara:strand:+ start:5209 stop:6483 length:1275 start_codon:yes stop_codon:yes gene_type:complete